MDVFRVRLNCIDHYQAHPTKYDPQLRNDIHVSQLWKEPQVPVIRIFGSTGTGQKVCAHIHGAFPYLFIEYRGPLDKAIVGDYIYRLHNSIDRALAVSYRRNEVGKQPRYVARITLVKGVPFYGYHVGYRFYLKIYMMNPRVIGRLADLLREGVIMGHKFQPHEAHMQYLAQFMCDFNLFGCDYVETDNVFFRAPVPQNDGDNSLPGMWDSRSAPPERITDDHRLPRASKCSIEVDICVKDILNRRDVKERQLHHDFVEMKNPLPDGLKHVHSMAGLWKDETKRRKRRLGDKDPGSSVFPAEVLVSMSADPRHHNLFGWAAEEELRREVQRLIDEEGRISELSQLTFSNFVEKVPHEENVKTVLESVEDLFPENLLPALGLDEKFLHTETEGAKSIEIDEKGILEFLDQDSKDQASEDSDGAVIGDVQQPDPGSAEDLPPEEPPAKGGALAENDAAKPVVPSTHLPLMEIKSDAVAEEQKPRTINGLTDGFLVSGLVASRRPRMPFCSELLAEAESLGVAGNVKGSGPADPNEACRSSSLVGEDKPPKKRNLEELEEPEQPDKLPEAANLENHNFATELGGGSQRDKTPNSKRVKRERSKPSQPSKRAVNGPASAKEPGSQPLNFPVVKDPQSLNVRLRLSQKTASQPSQESAAKRQVTFDPLLPIQEKATNSTLNPTTPGPKTALSAAKAPETPLRTLSKLRWGGPNRMYLLNHPPPPVHQVLSSLQSYGIPDVIYQDAFYSKEVDIPPRAKEFAGREFRLDGNSLPYLPKFDATGQSPAALGIKPDGPLDLSAMEMEYKRQQKQCTLIGWEIAEPPPTYHDVKKWWQEKQGAHKAQLPNSSQPPPPTQKHEMSQIVGATPKTKHNFKYSQRKKSTSVRHEAQYMSTMSLELHVNTRGKLLPNPEEDEIQCIFWCLKSDEQSLLSSSTNKGRLAENARSGIVVLSEDGSLADRVRKQTTLEVAEETSELDVMIRIAEVVRTYDPDILTGYEVHGSSWGYLVERASVKYDYDLCDDLSRMKADSHGRFGKEADRWGFNTSSTLHITGRHMINIWRAMRGELNLLQYSMENVVWHLLHRRIPHYSWQTLTHWYVSGRPGALYKVLRYYQVRTQLDLDILEANELVARTSEQARLLGVDFFSVISRGSQFKVESIMFRIAKPENFILPSPGRKQVGGQNALECLPLVMEPQSAFYSSPLIVLDFQSLYPSVMIAYNYCYSTFLGRIANWRGGNKMGFTEYKRRDGLLRLLKDYINIAPNGIMYTKPEIRKSLLAKMLTEILETRVMVKSGMKQDKDDKTLQQLLNNRQLALKLLANVTYGYASASFSGRMPCSEIADSIVQTARETLERSIAYIHSVERWNAEVVYGDTDSLFISVKGRTREQAFDIGAEIAKEITNMNPRPMKLKFEKVYHPCVLVAKKRYVGYKYETRDQTVPEFDAKGIETVRRDGTPATQIIEEKAIKVLFETADLSQVKSYLQDQMDKILRGAVSIGDFCYAKEVKLGTYSDKGPGPAGAVVATRRMLEDARAEPQYGERIPYVVAAGPPNALLVDKSMSPEDFMADPEATLDSEHYIVKSILAPLDRIFSLVGANVRQWYDEMPRPKAPQQQAGAGGVVVQKKLDRFMRSGTCVRCGVKRMTARAAPDGPADDDLPICRRCAADAAASMVALQNKVNAETRKLSDVVKVCQTCAGHTPMEEVPCDSKDCPVYYTRVKYDAKLKMERSVIEPVVEALGRGLLDW